MALWPKIYVFRCCRERCVCDLWFFSACLNSSVPLKSTTMKIIADTNIPFVKECLSSIGDVTTIGGRQITAEVVKEADILLVRSITRVDEPLLGESSVKFAATATIGIDHIDQQYLAANNIGFAYAPGSNANSVAEYIVAALLALAKKHRFTLAGKSIGIVGVGNVGSKVEAKCRALGMNVLLNDPPLARKTSDLKYLPLSDLYDCDFITMHTPLTRDGQDKTYHLAGTEFFSSLKPGTFFLNSSRGPVADTKAVTEALASKRLAGIVLDVWENEPDIDPHLLLKAELSTPHVAGYSYDGKVAGMIMIYKAACEHFGLTPSYTAEDFLPAPAIPAIEIDPDSAPGQTIIHDTVQQIYTINRDDFNTREILLQPPDQRGAFFDQLRKEYPVRREFQNTNITGTAADSDLGRTLSGLGFKL